MPFGLDRASVESEGCEGVVAPEWRALFRPCVPNGVEKAFEESVDGASSEKACV
jgi:hypothetical protein